MINGLMILLLAVAVREAFRQSNPVLSQLCYVAGFLCGLGFLATGINDIPGNALSALLREQNPDYNTAILLMMTTIRSIVNIIAITGLGLFAAFTGRAALLSGNFSRWGAWFGFILLIPGIGGLINPVFGFTYLSFVPIWMIWLGLQFKAQAARS
jgi:hypothetical protein